MSGREVEDELVRAACRRRVLPLARGMALLTPLIGVALWLVSTTSTPTTVAWLALTAASSLAAVAVSRWMPVSGDPDGDLRRWERRYGAYVVATVALWSTAPWVLRPPLDAPEHQTLQVLLLTMVGNTLVLLGAFLPRLSRLAVGVLSAGTMGSLALAGIGVDRWLVAFIPVYTLLSWWMQGRLHEAASVSIRLSVENERLLRRLGRDQQELAHQASHDLLTGLLNRAAFAELAEQRVLAAAGAGAEVAVAYLDLDGFKGLNDAHGHAVGDAVLRAVGARLRGAVRQGDLVARIGGDEFTVLFGSAADAHAAGERILDAFRAPVAVDALQLHVGCSAGIAVAGPDGADLDQLLRRADAALYRAKDAGRGRVALSVPGATG